MRPRAGLAEIGLTRRMRPTALRSAVVVAVVLGLSSGCATIRSGERGRPQGRRLREAGRGHPREAGVRATADSAKDPGLQVAGSPLLCVAGCPILPVYLRRERDAVSRVREARVRAKAGARAAHGGRGE